MSVLIKGKKMREMVNDKHGEGAQTIQGALEKEFGERLYHHKDKDRSRHGKNIKKKYNNHPTRIGFHKTIEQVVVFLHSNKKGSCEVTTPLHILWLVISV